MRRSMWIVTADWYDDRDGYVTIARTKRAAIREFRALWIEPKTWTQCRREGWRCVRATVTWGKP